MRAILTLCVTLAASIVSAQTRSVYIEDLTWMEVRDAIAAGSTSAVLYAGGVEQNGPHMALVKHNAIAHYAAGQIAARLGNALVYPVMPFSPAGDPLQKIGHARFPGTVTVSSEVFLGVMRQEALSAIAAGFKNVFLMGDHGGGQNELKLAAESLDADWKPKGTRVFYVADLQGKATELTNAYLSERKIPGGGHAGVAETSQVMYLADLEKHNWIRRDKLTAAKGQPEPATGINGDPSPGTIEMGKIFLDFKINSAVDQIRALSASR
jgi:creatinine amidohydrolase/Fe(II)-dependent formamide hydrolase-like protein